MILTLKELRPILNIYKILYVEDDPNARESTGELLKNIFSEVVLKEDGNEGFKYFSENKDKIDIIFTDLNMPNMNGIEMISQIREINKHIPIVIISAFEKKRGYYITKQIRNK